jgi:SNF2 family DNA or RNA helicase
MPEVPAIIALLKKSEQTGFTIQPYLYFPAETLYITPLERISSLNFSDFEQLPVGAEEFYNLSLQLEPAFIVQQFTKKKMGIKDFFEQKGSLIEEIVKPFIDKKISELIELLTLFSFPLYDASALPHLYPVDQIQIEKSKAQTVLRFDRKEDGTIYSLQAFINKQKINLQQNGNFLLSTQPCYLVTEKRIIGFEKGINGKLLTPFLLKEQIEIPARLENKYFSTFIKKIVNTSDIKATGFKISDVEIKPEALLTYEVDWQGKHCLVLKYKYGEKTFLPNNPQKNFTDLTSDDEGFTFYRSKRNKTWEDEQKKVLSSFKLVQSDNCFRLKEDGDAKDNKYSLTEWLILNKEALIIRGFAITQELTKEFCLSQPKITHQVVSGNDWFDLNIIVSIGGFDIPFSKFRKHILNRQREYILPDGRIFILPLPWFENYRQLMIHVEIADKNLHLRKHHYKILEALEFEEVITFKPVEPEQIIELPQLHDVILRPYQIFGYQWLKRLTEIGFGGILADDMGLGKTLQTIALLSSYYSSEAKREIIVPPAIPNKIQKKPVNTTVQLGLFDQPNESTGMHSDKVTTARDSKPCSLLVMPASLIHNWVNEFTRFAPYLKILEYTGYGRKQSHTMFRKYNILLTTYGTLRNDIEFLKEYTFAFCILDESQQIKNPTSKTSQATFDLKALNRFVLTGTPVENNLTDLWSQMNFVNPGLLGPLSTFNSFYAGPLSKDPENKLSENLLKMIEPFILRRTKESVAPELPELTETVRYCYMTEEQNALYETEKSKVRNLMFDQLEKGNVSSTPVMVLKALMQLRQIANHPKMINPASDIESGKFEEVTDKLETIIQENHRVLIFSSFVKHLSIFAEYCDQRGFGYALLTGSTANRGKVISEFKARQDTKIFLISMKAGGVGLNLTEADYVFMLDPWWNPAAEMQAVNRAHRIGQFKNVFVYRFITKNTIEEKIMKLQEKKKALADTFIRPQETITGMSREEILQLFE